jgi:hypothetical protein
MWWTDGSRTDDGRVGAAAVCKHGDGWRSFRSHLGTGRMEVYDVELWAIGVTLSESVKKRERLMENGVTIVAVFSDSQAAIRRTEHLEPGPGQPLARLLTRDLTRWLRWRLAACSPHRLKAAGMRPVACGPHRPLLPPSASPAPMPCMRPSLGTGTRLWAPALAVGMAFLFSLVYKFIVCFSCIGRQLSFFVLSLLLSTQVDQPQRMSPPQGSDRERNLLGSKAHRHPRE